MALRRPYVYLQGPVNTVLPKKHAITVLYKVISKHFLYLCIYRSPPGVFVTIDQPIEKVVDKAVFKFTMWFGGCLPVHWTAVHNVV